MILTDLPKLTQSTQPVSTPLALQIPPNSTLSLLLSLLLQRLVPPHCLLLLPPHPPPFTKLAQLLPSTPTAAPRTALRIPSPLLPSLICTLSHSPKSQSCSWPHFRKLLPTSPTPTPPIPNQPQRPQTRGPGISLSKRFPCPTSSPCHAPILAVLNT